MSKIKQIATTLRAEAEKLENYEKAILPRAEDVIRQIAPTACHVRNELPLDYVGRSNFDARRHLARQAAAQLAEHIVPTLEFERVGGSFGMRQSVWPVELYETKVYALTPSQMKVLVEKAIRAGAGLL